MPSATFNPLSPSGARARLRFPVTVALCAMLFTSTCRADTADPEVARHMGAFFSAFTGRDLTSDELHALTLGFVDGHGKKGRDRDAIRQIARQFDESTRTLREHKDDAIAFSLRDRLLQANYYSLEKSSMELRLFLEPDPVRVSDAKVRRLMTEQDVIALANIRYFAKSSGPPQHKNLSRQQIEDLVALLNAEVGGNRGLMPQFFGEASAFWAGVREHWPKLSETERDLARAYASKTWRIQLLPQMYGRLWGLSPSAATSRYADDVGARISAITQINIGLGNLPAQMDAIFGR